MRTSRSVKAWNYLIDKAEEFMILPLHILIRYGPGQLTSKLNKNIIDYLESGTRLRTDKDFKDLIEYSNYLAKRQRKIKEQYERKNLKKTYLLP